MSPGPQVESPSTAGNVDTTSPIQPRWEWRVFEPFPGVFIESVRPPSVGENASIETYIVSAASPHNVKIRDGQLDVKMLEDTRDGSLELWRPVFKQPFPIDPRDLAPVWKAWGVPQPPLRRASYTIEQFIDEIVPSIPGLRAVPITKRRAPFTILDCRAERAVVTVGGSRWDTLALEDEDPERILLAQRTFDRALPRGANYPAMLKQIAGTSATLTSSTRVLI